MKKSFCTLAVAAFFILSCSKTNHSGQDILAGKWELRQYTGGIAGEIKYAAGNGNIVQFDKVGNYKYISSSVVTNAGTYQLSRASNAGDWMLNRQYNYNGQLQTTIDSVHIANNKLIFIARWTFCDAPTIIYEKLQ